MRLTLKQQVADVGAILEDALQTPSIKPARGTFDFLGQSCILGYVHRLNLWGPIADIVEEPVPCVGGFFSLGLSMARASSRVFSNLEAGWEGWLNGDVPHDVDVSSPWYKLGKRLAYRYVEAR